jgi:hypothetical protein
MLVLLFVTLSLFFHGVYLPGHTLFSNDGPLARLMSESHKLPERFTGCWQDLNSSGYREPSALPDITYGLLLLLKPVGFSKFYAISALLVLGMGAWFFFRQSGLAPPACILGGLAAVFNSCFFSDACWGTAAHTIAVGMTFFALAALADNSSPRRWLRVILAGFAVGMAVTEGADFGAIFSLFVAVFIIGRAWLERGPRARNLTIGVGRLALVAVCAAVFSARAISDLVATDVIDVNTAQAAAATPDARWDWATRWSLPKRETLSLIVPGIFGYRSDAAGSGTYWGNIGRDPSWLHFDENGHTGPAPTGASRYTGGGFYAGVTVALIALWAALQALRRKDSVFNLAERKTLLLLLVMGAVALLLSYGRYAPLYGIFYRLPYVSMIRNPDKFLNVVSFSIVVLFAFGVDGLWRQYMRPADSRIALPWAGLKNWWKTLAGFEKNWARGCRVALIVSLVAWIFYAFSRGSLEDYMRSAHILEADVGSVAAFSIWQVGWFVLFFTLAAGLMLLIISGRFAGVRARWGAILLGLLLVADLGRADLPWIIFWDYQAKYESNPIVDSFREKPWEQRVAEFPLRPPPKYQPLERLYRLIWVQQLFPWYNIQSLDIVQLSRTPDDLADYNVAFRPYTFADANRVARQWQLTNTRYLLGAAVIPDFLVQHLGATAPPLKVVSRFSIVPKPGRVYTTGMDGMTAVPDTNGDYAVMEFTGALPRAKLYSNWQVNPSGRESLDLLVNPSFDPAQTVLVAGGVPAPAPAAATNQDPGTVEITSYAPKDVVLKSDVRSPAVLLLNDRFEPAWKVTVDGTPQTVLRCNYLMRGVYLEPGLHTVEFKYQPPFHALYISLAALGVGIVLLGVVVVAEWRAPVPVLVPDPAPVTAPRPQPVPAPKPPAPAATPPKPNSNKQKKRAGKSRR